MKGLTKIQNDYVQCFPFTHQAGDLIMEGDQITKAGLSLDESMKSFTLDNFLDKYLDNGSWSLMVCKVHGMATLDKLSRETLHPQLNLHVVQIIFSFAFFISAVLESSHSIETIGKTEVLISLVSIRVYLKHRAAYAESSYIWECCQLINKYLEAI